MSMIKCSNCGRSVSDTEKVCPHCEEKIEKKLACSRCGNEDVDFSLLGKTGIFECKQCGYKFTVSQTGEIRDYAGAKVEDFNILTAFLSIYKKIFDFKGRARRKEYWLSLPLFYLTFGLMYVLIIVAGFSESVIAIFLCIVLLFVYSIATAVGMLAMEIRRLHDTGRPWHSIFVTYIPLVGQFLLLYYMIEDSQLGPNEYGPNPKGKE